MTSVHTEDLPEQDIPEHYTAAHLRAEDVGMFAGEPDKDVRRSLRVGQVPMPELAPDEVLVAMMASAINYNTLWSATFEPLSTFGFLQKYAKQGRWESRHDQPYQVVGSDGAGVIVKVGDGVRRWQRGNHVLISPVQADDQDPVTHADAMISGQQRVWGFETNFGGLAEYAVVRASQLIPKPGHLSWEEAASMPLCNSTAYRMLVSERGARMKQGDVVLVWGAAGGLGVHAVQMVKNGGGIAVAVVGSERKAEVVRKLGADVVIDRREIGLGEGNGHDPAAVLAAGKRLGGLIRKHTGEDPHIAFDYVGQATFGTSVFVVRRGGVVVTCGSSTGYQHQYDNRYLWMKLNRVIGSHGANLQEQWEANRLAELGQVVPVLSGVYPLSEVGEAARLVQQNQHIGKVSVLCQAKEPGLGITDPAARARIGEARLRPLEG
ncbi:crotonyl-CoA carboxylase/reductase [Crossiella cryophila]|uniref:Crotonyl-CoA reductase n=1 Tax=Crossiella cryophila TaxID=43355 RepID=A0A7W7CBX6_9PSEU|nr:crotonyl-CoA carboxylase/reductase [Crossiella cryophila]MBB4678285.1 crotonyl-CoA reductase [Crossiella cryophila]